MKLTKKLEAEILKVYNTIWDAYLRGDMRTFASILDENCYIIGTAAGEVFKNKKAAVKYYKSTAEQITGKAEFRNRKIQVMPVEKDLMVNEEADFYLLINDQWTFYGPGRISSLFHKKNKKWKVFHQHGSFPDSKTEEGEQVNADKIKAENIQLRNAVKRRTEELENKNRELEIEAALERVRARAMAMQSSDELIEVANVMRQQMVELGQSGFDTAAVHLYSDDSEYFDSWYSFRQGDPVTGKIVTGKTKFKKDSCRMLREMVEAYHLKENDYTLKASGEKLKEWFSLLTKTIPEIKINVDKNPGSNYIHFSDFSGGSLVMATFQPPTQDSMILQKRCAAVFDLAYRRYVDLQRAEAQAREAQIEAALERVRSQSMAMHKSNDLQEVIKVVTEQLIGLDLKFDHANFSKITSDGSWDLWISTPKHSYPAQVHVPYIDLSIFKDLNEVIAKGTDFFTKVYSSEEKNKFFDHFFENTIAKNTPEDRKQYVLNANGFARSVFLTKNIWFSVGHYRTSLFTDEENAVFKRFANVFEQAYTRFLDLQKAEEQAREAQIEASLERVRSRSMAMHHSNDLQEVIKVVTDQLLLLGFKFNTANFAKVYADGSWDLWLSTPEQSYPERIYVPYFDHKIFNQLKDIIAERIDFFTDVYDKKESNKFFRHFFENTIAKNAPESRKQFVLNSNGFARSLFLMKDLWLVISNYDGIPYTVEENAVFKRFATVFEQAYIRFLDLQKAETQAREAEIELALERVRAKTMAMQKPSDFLEVINVIGEQFIHLGFDIEWANFGANGLEISKGIDIWNFAVIPGSDPISARVFIPYFDHPVFMKAVEGLDEYRKSGTDLFMISFGKEDKDHWLDHLFTKTVFKDVPGEYRSIQYAKPGYTTSNLALKDTWLSIGKFDVKNFTDEQHAILRRFGNAFGQAYTRFLDLQKAEAQSRESQIELGLERVRARAMAMQNSDELKELIGTVFIELTKLDLVLTRCLIVIFDPKTKGSTWWMANSEAPSDPIGLYVKYHEHPPYLSYVKAWQERNLKWQYILEEKDKKEWDEFLFVETELSHLPDFVIAGMKAPERVYLNASFNSFGNLTLASLEPLSNEHFDILLRFAKVFDLTYTRFNDLKQAEAQTKEAQIELALERVRARTMAMHKSEELAETAQVLFRQLSELGGFPDRIAIGIADEVNSVVNFWSTDQQGSHLNNSFSARLNERTTIAKTYQAWKEQKKSLVIDLHGEELKEWIQFAREEMGIAVKDDQIKDRRVHTLAFFSHGWILVTSHEPQSTNTTQVLERFASVFNLTYRRFLDLQKAEAQANEARIEIALERIRARALAMHKSDELMEVARVVWEQMTLLGQRELESSVVHLYEVDPDYIHSYRTVSINRESNAALTYGHMAIPKNSCEVVREWLANFHSDLTEYTIEISGAKQQEWYELLFKLAPDVVNSMRQKGDIHEKRYYRFSKFSGGALLMVLKQEPSEEASYLQRRAAVVFDLAYRRFSDLQKAEAQGREAQIEAALERVRSSSLAMHKSGELKDVVKVVFDNFRSLGLQNIDSVNINIFHEGSRDFDLWLAAPGQDYTTNFRLPYLDHPIANDFFEAVQKGETIHKGIYDHESKNKYFGYMFENSDNKHLPEERKKLILNGRAYSVATGIARHSSIFIHNYDGEAFSEETNGILVRFSKVFDQAYTRFLDLKKAETQAWEAQIELALERIRARTMAMQKSDELSETSFVLFQQFNELGEGGDQIGIGIFEEDEKAMKLYSTFQGSQWNRPARIEFKKHRVYQNVYSAWKDQKKSVVTELTGKELQDLNKIKLENPDYQVSENELAKDHWVVCTAFFSNGILSYASHKTPPKQSIELLERFASVFDLTYTRFLDLKKAEAQGREAQIEASLERVRSKTMAMHNSQDVGETVAVMFDELRKLDIETLRCGVGIMQENYQMELWTARPDATGKAEFIVGHIDMKLHPLLTGGYEAWKNRAEGFFYQLKDEDLKTYFEAINNHQAYAAKYDISSLPSLMFHYEFNFNEGCLFAFSIKQFSDESSQIFKRFTGVFGQTYRRYLDLQKAEANAREAQIEAGLERVRAKAMAMHSSKDLAETLSVFYRELKSLSVVPIRCGVALMDKETRMAELTTMNTTGEGDSIEIIGKIKMAGHPVLDGVFKNWLVQKEYHAVLRGNQIKEYYQVLKPQIDYLDYSHDEAQFGYYFMFNEGDVYAWTEKELTEDEQTIYRRFTTVISLTYKRYKDLQQAEAQAREAKIEAGLERVRARTMAMHNSEDVGAATATMFTELEKLGIQNLRGGITIIKAGDKQEVWGVTNLADGKTIRSIGEFDMHLHPLWRELLKAKNDNGDYNYYRLAGKDKEDYINILNATPNYLSQPIKEFPDVHVQSYFFGEGAIWTNSLEPHSEDQKQTMKRFASVFSLTFRRYQDLKKAEAQAREATIEAALEKVRGKAMAMHNSNDLSTTASIVFTELRKLGISPIRCGVGLLNKESRKGQIYAAASSGDEDSLSLVGWVQLSGHPVLEKIYDTWKDNEDYFPELNGEQMKTYYDLLLSGLSVSVPDTEEKQYGTFLPFSVGCLYAWSETPYNDSELKILKRFASIIDLTFRRYIELQKSEATAKEAIKQAALDRIRADIASMRTINDLDRITPLIWNELTVLGIPFIRCGVFIMDEDHQLIHTFLSTPDGKAIAAFHLPYDTPGNLRHVVTNWKENKKYIDHWDEKEFIQFADILLKGGALVSAEQYLKTIPKGGFYLHFLPFLQGMLYVGNGDQLKEEQIELIQHVADAFSTAYARYEDFNKLEAAKQQVEKTLTDLKQAQQQLVQSEKMASLGEMTAGIAHEIQNPLNFVNNFSEVSKELLDEMKTELASGNTEDAKEIADDVIQNLEKINHHGKRADAIVKSMLQHSRSSSGKKEPTDINALADEYLRLAYHGLRAKDKSFNAKFETAFDDSIGKINIISQDIGRVLVNLINNAFYSVNERKKHESNGYEPTVEVLTKKTGDKIEIKVKDNGSGIPKKVLDKIFQPFFTTKPTGQGTGLGLSLAYDIITKGHGGELKVETKEGEGSEFIIQLPNQPS